MREFELILDEAFAKGLSPLEKTPNNSQYFRRCLGFRSTSGELEAHEELSNPLPTALSLDYVWPYPQFIVGEGYNVLAVQDSTTGYVTVYMVSEDHQTITTIYEIQPVLNTVSMLEVADFGEYIFMTNGAGMIYWDAESGVWQRIAEHDTIPTMRTVANFKGQAVGGCVLSDWYDCDETFYIWSQIGSMDFTLDKSNEAGYRRCPYGGVVYNTRRLGDTILGYSSKGVTSIYPASSVTAELGTGATFGFRGVSDVGLLNRGAVGGSWQRQVYVGEDYIIRSVTKDGLEELGYKEHMEQLVGEDVIVNYDSVNGDYYIGNSTKTFLLSKNGLTEVLQHPSTVWVKSGQAYMLPDAVDSDSPYLCSYPFDMGYRGVKTVHSMETDALGVQGAEAGIDWMYEQTWGTEHYQPLNNEGIASNVVAGHSFRFRLRFDSLNSDARISYLKARYKMSDMRGIRGIYAPPPRGQ